MQSRSFAIVAIVLLTLRALSAHAGTGCPNQITSCGCVIGAAGDYKVIAPLNQSPGGSFCLEVDAPGVRLDLGSNSITGPPSSPPPSEVLNVGIQLTKRAAKAIIVGGGATISSFEVGVEIQGGGSFVSDVKADQNGEGIDLNSSDVQLTQIDASNNRDNGLNLFSASENRISNLTANGNASAGIWVSNISDANRISSFQANSNGDVGVRISALVCGAAISGPPCHQRGGRGNYLIGGDASGNQVGIFTEKGSMSTIIGNTATMNAQADLEDDSPNCDGDLWFGNTFTIASPSSCIH